MVPRAHCLAQADRAVKLAQVDAEVSTGQQCQKESAPVDPPQSSSV